MIEVMLEKAEEDYPGLMFLASLEGIPALKDEIKRALDEIDAGRSAISYMENHSCAQEMSYFMGGND